MARAGLRGVRSTLLADKKLGRVQGRWISGHLQVQWRSLWWLAFVAVLLLMIGLSAPVQFDSYYDPFIRANLIRWFPVFFRGGLTGDSMTSITSNLTAYGFWFGAIVFISRYYFGRLALARRNPVTFVW